MRGRGTLKSLGQYAHVTSTVYFYQYGDHSYDIRVDLKEK